MMVGVKSIDPDLSLNDRGNPVAAFDVDVSNDAIGDLGSPLGSSSASLQVRVIRMMFMIQAGNCSVQHATGTEGELSCRTLQAKHQ